MIDTLLFDLDDTLYPEAEFVRSGHSVVASEVARYTGKNSDIIFRILRYEYLKYGRSGLFDRLVNQFNIDFSIIGKLVDVYREHIPSIALKQEIKDMLLDLGNSYRLGLVTDGSVEVQRRKVEALGLPDLMDTVVYSWAVGAAKPDPASFEQALFQLDAVPSRALIIGDDPVHDVEAAARTGIACIRVVAHRYSEIATLDRPPLYAEVSSVLDVPAAIAGLVDTRI